MLGQQMSITRTNTNLYMKQIATKSENWEFFLLLGTINVVLDVIDRLLIKVLYSADIGEKNGSMMAQYINYS